MNAKKPTNQRHLPPSSALFPRQQAVLILVRCKRNGAFVNILLGDLAHNINISASVQRFVAAMVKGVLESEERLSNTLTPLLRKGISSLPLEIQCLLQVAVYQLCNNSGSNGATEKAPKIINESVELTKLLGFKGLAPLVNATLRRVASSTRSSYQDAPGENLSHPGWLIDRWSAAWGRENAVAIAQANNQPWSTFLRVNSLKTTSAKLQSLLLQEGVVSEPVPGVSDSLRITKLNSSTKLNDLKSFVDGLFFVQDSSSSLVIQAADPQPNEMILDICAAPGGKSMATAIAALDQGSIIAADLSLKKLNLLMTSTARLHLNSIGAVAADARQPPFAEGFDLVLVDAPCSGTGTIGRKADLRISLRPEKIATLIPLQLEILTKAALLVRPGGRLVYSTCSLEVDENEEVVRAFLGANKEFSALKPGKVSEQFITRDEFVRTWPHLHNMGGAFAALMRRRKD